MNNIEKSDDELFALDERVAKHIFDRCTSTIIPEIYIQNVECKPLLVVEIFPGFLKVIPLDTDQVTDQVTVQVTDHVSQEVLRLLGILHGEMTWLRIQNALGLKAKTNFKSRFLKPALADGLIELTIPDKPSSSKQKYRLTERGRSIVKKS